MNMQQFQQALAGGEQPLFTSLKDVCNAPKTKALMNHLKLEWAPWPPVGKD